MKPMQFDTNGQRILLSVTLPLVSCDSHLKEFPGRIPYVHSVIRSTNVLSVSNTVNICCVR